AAFVHAHAFVAHAHAFVAHAHAFVAHAHTFAGIGAAIDPTVDHGAVSVKRSLRGADAPVVLFGPVEPDHGSHARKALRDGRHKPLAYPGCLFTADLAGGGLRDHHRLRAQLGDDRIGGGEDRLETFPLAPTG